jgi:Ring finger domain
MALRLQAEEDAKLAREAQEELDRSYGGAAAGRNTHARNRMDLPTARAQPRPGPAVPMRHADAFDGELDYDRLVDLPRVEVGVDKRVLNALPVSAYTPPAGRPADECSVCLDKYCRGATVLTLPCLHFFHESCVQPWLKANKSCPVCKVEVSL